MYCRIGNSEIGRLALGRGAKQILKYLFIIFLMSTVNMGKDASIVVYSIYIVYDDSLCNFHFLIKVIFYFLSTDFIMYIFNNI